MMCVYIDDIQRAMKGLMMQIALGDNIQGRKKKIKKTKQKENCRNEKNHHKTFGENPHWQNIRNFVLPMWILIIMHPIKK